MSVLLSFLVAACSQRTTPLEALPFLHKGYLALYSTGLGDLDIVDLTGQVMHSLPIVESHAGTLFDFAWSPDGARIVVYGYPDDMPKGFYLLNVDGSGLQLLLDDSADLFTAPSPTWSPDGSYIALEKPVTPAHCPKGTIVHQIHLLSPDQGTLEPLVPVTGCQLGDSHPTWSPDSAQVAFVRFEESLRSWLYIADVRAATVRRVESPQLSERRFIVDPDWSPDGRYIAFSSNRQPRYGSDLFTLDLETGDLKRLTNSDDFECTSGLMCPDYTNPHWSPDGSKIAFVASPKGGKYYLYVLDLRTGETMQVTSRWSETLALDYSWVP